MDVSIWRWNPLEVLKQLRGSVALFAFIHDIACSATFVSAATSYSPYDCRGESVEASSL